MNATPQDLEQLRRQRATLAERIRLPWWYLTVAAVMMATVMTAPFLSEYFSPVVSEWAALVPLLVMIGLDRLWARTTGVKLPRRMTRSYPSVRPIRWVTLAVAIVGYVTERLLLAHGQTALAVVVVVIMAAVTVGLLVRRTAAVRKDITEGRATSR
ncbi:hypothetical protein [Actinoallomurus rhizosphaericola]|uniref:hypothetical protein n=1 Tax=Actinoallomurus rhizosphaericola TaxID=2952536 RepID=UPI0020932231|nr:hypothetical protein [Actinoallomurus rhizosphaericola]MCO5995791.1 hypothetical protein [Actinoallomurus rhizosphaericola]